jgi:hypothetical protein
MEQEITTSKESVTLHIHAASADEFSRHQEPLLENLSPYICALPQGFELTEQRWAKILEAHEVRGEFLTEDEVAALFES